MSYRADIDGLRAIAVSGVVLFHADVPGFRGGFTGVDVFFVISGFLIAGLIVGQIERGEFDLLSFWVRRARRILPALLTVIICSAALFSIALPPTAMMNFGQSILAQLFFASNILFWLESGYFDLDSLDKPLLHTWSLSVEEQFYVLAPLLLLSLARRGNQFRMGAIAAVGILSFAACILLTRSHSGFAFFMLPTRAWELLIGVWLALILRNSPEGVRGSPTLAAAVALGGLAAIASSFTLLDKNTHFPGYAALLPTLGTAAVIWAGASAPNLLTRLLSVPPLVALGLVSYSVYLWHWLALSFNNAIHIDEPGQLSVMIALVLSFAAAVISYRYVELPARRREFLASNRNFVAACVLVAFVAAGAGTTYHLTQGLPGRLANDSRQIYETAMEKSPRGRECYNLFRRRSSEIACNSGFSDPGSTARVLVWGDSHAEALLPALEAAARAAGVPFWFTALGGCPSVTNVHLVNTDYSDLCRRYNDAVVNYAIENRVRDLIIVNRFSVYVNNRAKTERNRPDVLISAESGRTRTTPEAAMRDFQAAFAAMAEKLQAADVRIHIVTQFPEFGIDAPNAFFKVTLTGRQPEFSRPFAAVSGPQVAIESYLVTLGIRIIDLRSAFCPDAQCSPFRDGRPLYRDDDHIGLFGARLVEGPLAVYLATLR